MNERDHETHDEAGVAREQAGHERRRERGDQHRAGDQYREAAAQHARPAHDGRSADTVHATRRHRPPDLLLEREEDAGGQDEHDDPERVQRAVVELVQPAEREDLEGVRREPGHDQTRSDGKRSRGHRCTRREPPPTLDAGGRGGASLLACRAMVNGIQEDDATRSAPRDTITAPCRHANVTRRACHAHRARAGIVVWTSLRCCSSSIAAFHRWPTRPSTASTSRPSKSPSPGANTIAWLVWHAGRAGPPRRRAQRLRSDLDPRRLAFGFRLDPDPSNTGYGHTASEVAAVRPERVELLIEYLEAVDRRTRLLLENLTPKALDRIVDRRWDPPVTLGVRLVSIADDSLQHLGQAAYLRGLLVN